MALKNLKRTHRENNKTTQTGTRMRPSLPAFFALIFLLSVPLWVLGMTDLVALPPNTPLYTPNLLWHVAIALLPMIAALILVYQKHGAHGVKQLFWRPFDATRIKVKIWYVPIFLLFPSLMVLEYGLLHYIGVSLPNLSLPDMTVPVFFVLFFVLGIGEELGWTGYALDPLQERWTALGAGLGLGIVSAVWHLVPLLEEPHTPMWIVWHLAHMLPLRVITVWLYNNTQSSMFAVVAFHASVNIGQTVWPFYGTTGYYNPFVASIFLIIVATIATILWGPQTLAHYRYARLRDSIEHQP